MALVREGSNRSSNPNGRSSVEARVDVPIQSNEVARDSINVPIQLIGMLCD
jgi:hypothetical protein